jgi:hypothetical protein
LTHFGVILIAIIFLISFFDRSLLLYKSELLFVFEFWLFKLAELVLSVLAALLCGFRSVFYGHNRFICA